MINTQEEAIQYVDTNLRKEWLEWAKKTGDIYELGEAKILEEKNVDGHKAWSYYIEGLPMSRNGRKRWILDTGEKIDTTLKQDEDTIEKAYKKLKGIEFN